MLTSEEWDTSKSLCFVAHSPLGGSGAPAELAEVHEATRASWRKGFRFPRNLDRHLFYTGDPFSVFSLQFCGPTLFVVARLRCQSRRVLDTAMLGLETAKAPTAPWCALHHFAGFPLPFC